MRFPRLKWTVRRMMAVGAVVAGVFAVVDQVKMYQKVQRYRATAEFCARESRRCREIVAMDPETRARKKKEAWESYDEYQWSRLNDVEWTEQQIISMDSLEQKYREAAAHPRSFVPSSPPVDRGPLQPPPGIIVPRR